ncbi:PTS glucose transporter subunit IIA [Pediococcus siamensis]|uniref:PTS sugar transporter subunit IIA n=1 Tax=Pediococcus siamensis TaxID=381829 RepID=UPI00399FAFD0
MQIFKHKSQKFSVVAPIAGECIPLEKVKDDVFSKKMMGEGFAIIPSQKTDVVVAPIDGEIIMIPDSLHAIGMRSNTKDVEILIHIGLDTVALAGKGFKGLVKPNTKVKAGMPLIKIDWHVMKEHNLDMSTMIIFTKGYSQPIELGSLDDTLVHSSQVLLREQ